MTALLLVCGVLAAADSPQPMVRDEFDEPLASLIPRAERSELDQDRIYAESLYAQGRVLLQRRDGLAALRRFERAWRYYPQAASIVPRVVHLAHQLGRSDEAARYALRAPDQADLNPAVLRQLGVYLAGRQEWRSALNLFERSLSPRGLAVSSDALDLANEADGVAAGDAGDAGAEKKSDSSTGTDPDDDLAALLVYSEIGRLALLTGDFAKSAAYFARVEAALSDPEGLAGNEVVKQALLGQADRAHRLMAEAFFRAGKYAQAETALRQAFPQPHDHETAPAFEFYLARLAAKLGREDEARRRLETYFASRSSVAGREPYALLAELVNRAEPDSVVADRQLSAVLERVLEADPRNSALISYLANRDLQAERFEAAERRYEQLLTLAPNSEVYAGLASVYRRQNRAEELVELCGIMVAKGASFLELTALLEPMQNTPELRTAAIALVRSRQDAAPKQLAAGAWIAAAVLLDGTAAASVSEMSTADTSTADAPSGEVASGEVSAGEVSAGTASTADALMAEGLSRLDSAARAEYVLGWGRRLLLAGRGERAAPALRQAFELPLAGQQRAAAYFYLVRALALAGKIDESAEAAAEAAAAFPAAPRIVALTGWVEYQAKRYSEAERAYEDVLGRFDEQSAPEIREALRDVRSSLANVYIQSARMAGAEEQLERVLDEFPDDIGALNDLGYIWADQGRRLTRALSMIERAVADQPDNAAYRDSYGWTLFRLGRVSEAIRELERAAATDDPDGVILDHLGDAYWQAGREAEAVAAWRRAVTAFAKEDEQERKRATQQKIQRSE